MVRKFFGDKDQGLFSVFENLTETVGDAFKAAEEQIGAVACRKAFSIDVLEQDQCYVVEANLPGVKKEDIDVSVSASGLTIKVMREVEMPPEGSHYLCNERWKSSGSRVIALRDAAEDQEVDATLQDGVLTLTIPRQSARQARTVQIK